MILAIKSSGKELSEDDRSLLATLYAQIGVSVDQLALDPTHLGDMVNRFISETGKTVSGERLLSELLRMHKQGNCRRADPAIDPGHIEALRSEPHFTEAVSQELSEPMRMENSAGIQLHGRLVLFYFFRTLVAIPVFFFSLCPQLGRAKEPQRITSGLSRFSKGFETRSFALRSFLTGAAMATAFGIASIFPMANGNSSPLTRSKEHVNSPSIT